MKLLFKTTPLLLLLGACSPTPAEQAADPVTSTEEAVMDRHDSLMAQMDQVMSLREKVGTTPAAMPYQRSLQAADAAMMDWMHHYAPDTTASKEQRLAYLRQQYQQLAGVQGKFRRSIDSATTYLKTQ